MKRPTDESDSDDDIPLAATPAKKARAAANTNDSSSSVNKKNVSSSTKKKTVSKKPSSPVKSPRKNLNTTTSPKKKGSPTKTKKMSPKKKTTSSSPSKRTRASPQKGSPKKASAATRAKQTKIGSFMNGHNSENSDSGSDADEASGSEEEESASFTAINDEKPARKRYLGGIFQLRLCRNKYKKFKNLWSDLICKIEREINNQEDFFEPSFSII